MRATNVISSLFVVVKHEGKNVISSIVFAKHEGDKPPHPVNLGHCERKALASDAILGQL